MRFLIDTHALIWHLEDDPLLKLEKSDLVDDPSNEPLVSIASLWEIAIKESLGKLKLSRSVGDLVKAIDHSTISILPVTTNHVVRVSRLPFHHKDPFDRLIIAQAMTEDISVITADPDFAAYGVNII
jgi:PIN domain nuclease of toxin-antitoxin system